MIIILKRADLSRLYANLETEKVRLFHFGISAESTQKAELVVFLVLADKRQPRLHSE
jgi:hypothetical protein